MGTAREKTSVLRDEANTADMIRDHADHGAIRTAIVQTPVAWCEKCYPNLTDAELLQLARGGMVLKR